MTDATPFTDAELPEVLVRLEQMAVLAGITLKIGGGGNPDFSTRIAATLAEIPALRKDKERLDYLETNRLSLECHSFGCTLWSADRGTPMAIRLSMGGTWRSCLDAARSAGEG